MPVSAADKYVKVGGTGPGTSWAAAAGSLELVLNTANAGDRILVMAGTYDLLGGSSQSGADSSTRTFQLKSGVRAYGSFPTSATNSDLWLRDVHATPSHVTGQFVVGSATSHSYHVVTVIAPQDPAQNQIDGFVIRDGQAIGDPTASAPDTDPPLSNVGGGVLFANPTWPSFTPPAGSSALQNCVIRENLAQVGGGFACNNSSSASPHPTIRASFIVDNRAVAEIGEDPIGSPGANPPKGGGGYLHSSSASLVSSVVSGNFVDGNGGGLAVARAGVYTLTNCTLSDNLATGFGGGMHVPSILGSGATVESCVIYFNTSVDASE